MFKFQSVRDVEEAYQAYDDFVVVSDLENGRELLNIHKNEMDDFFLAGIREIGIDRVEYFKAILLSPLREFVTGIDSFVAIQGDISMLKIEMDYAKQFSSYQQELLEVISNDNYLEVSKLACFCYQVFDQVERDLYHKQKCIYYDINEGYYSGFNRSMIQESDSFCSFFDSFFSQQLCSIKSPKTVEKVKKM